MNYINVFDKEKLVEDIITFIFFYRAIIYVAFLFFFILFILNTGPLIDFLSNLTVQSVTKNIIDMAQSPNCGIPGIISGILFLSSVVLIYFFLFAYMDRKGGELPANEDNSFKFLVSMPLFVLVVNSIFSTLYFLFIYQTNSYGELIFLIFFFFVFLIPNYILNGHYNRIIQNYDEMNKFFNFSRLNFKDLKMNAPEQYRHAFTKMPDTMNTLFFFSLLTMYIFYIFNYNVISIFYCIFLIITVYYGLSVYNKIPINRVSIVLKNDHQIKPVFILNDSKKGYLVILTNNEGQIKIMKDTIKCIQNY